MHPKRFGEALGFGARQAAVALARAAQAAATPAPASTAAPAARAGDPRRIRTGIAPGGLREGIRRFTSSVLRPARRAGSVLWLEVTGFLFGVFALLAGVAVWSGRAHLRPGPGQAHEIVGVVLCFAFGWFTVSNFVRAAQRSRRP